MTDREQRVWDYVWAQRFCEWRWPSIGFHMKPAHAARLAAADADQAVEELRHMSEKENRP